MKTTALICIAFAMAIIGCESSKKAVADKMAAESKFNDVPLTGTSLDAMEPSARAYVPNTESKINVDALRSTGKEGRNQKIHISRDTIVFRADTLKKFKN